MPRILSLIALLLILIAASGCLFGDDDDDPVTPPVEPPTFDTAAALVRGMVDIYNEAAVDDYQYLLHEDFQFVRKHNEGVFDRDEDIAIFQKMMTGVPGVGGVAFEDVVINGMQAIEGWNDVPDNDFHFGDFEGNAYSRPYSIDIDHNVSGQALTYRVTGLVVVYVVETDGIYQLLGFVDQTDGDKATEATTWSSVRSLFH